MVAERTSEREAIPLLVEGRADVSIRRWRRRTTMWSWCLKDIAPAVRRMAME